MTRGFVRPKQKVPPPEPGAAAPAGKGKGAAAGASDKDKNAGASSSKGKDANRGSSSASSSKTSLASGSKGSTAPAGAPAPAPPPPEIPERPYHQQLIKWTGKIPTTILAELCRRNGWNKPDVGTARRKGQLGLVGTVRLSSFDKKLGKDRSAMFSTPDTFGTSAEARQHAATNALAEVVPQMQLNRMLPPGYREYWTDIVAGVEKREGGKRTTQLDIFADPTPPPRPAPSASGGGSGKSAAANLNTATLSMEQLQLLEELVLDDNDGDDDLMGDAEGGGLSPEERAQLSKVLRGYGFPPSAVEECVKQCSSESDALDWLLLYLPTDDLPEAFSPPAQLSFVTVDRLSRDRTVLRLASHGFPRPKAEEAVDNVGLDETAALLWLLDDLVSGDAELRSVDALASSDAALMDEESITLEAILGDGYARTDATTHTIRLSCDGAAAGTTLLFFETPMYPVRAPAMAVQNAHLPSYVRLHLLRALYAEALRRTGSPMLYELSCFAQEQFDALAADPPSLVSLRERLNATSGGADDDEAVDVDAIAVPESTDDLALPESDDTKRSVVRRQVPMDARAQAALSEQLQAAQRAAATTAPVKAMRAVRDRLPAASFRAQFLEALSSSRVVIISGETGCGKTTQIPQFILEDMIERGSGGACNIVCTQPHRIAAVSVANRVAAERGESSGDVVGYAVRFDSAASKRTRLLFCTTGVLLRRLQDDTTLAGVTHIVLDEVHERSVDSDMALLLVRRLLTNKDANRELRIVLMSASFNAEAFAAYVEQALPKGRKVPLLTIPGFTHPVEDIFLEDLVRRPGFENQKRFTPNAEALEAYAKDGIDAETAVAVNAVVASSDGVIQTAARAVHFAIKTAAEKKGAILVFLSGLSDIRRCMNLILDGWPSDAPLKPHVLPLHSTLTWDEQSRVFAKPPAGHYKVVVSTNVAETSVTIDDIVYVIDGGQMKEMLYDEQTSTRSLVVTHVSQANARQRRGRAGRVRPGVCIKLYTSAQHGRMPRFPIEELARVPLDQVILMLLAGGRSIDLLYEMLTPPTRERVNTARQRLIDAQAIDADDTLTPLGRHLALIPADIVSGKCLVFGALFGCLDPMLSAAAFLSLRSPFVSPADKRAEAHQAHAKFTTGRSDLLSYHAAFSAWSKLRGREAAAFCSANFLSAQTLNSVYDMRNQFLDCLWNIGLLVDEAAANQNTANEKIVRGALCAALYPNIARVQRPQTKYLQTLQGAVAIEAKAKSFKLHTQFGERVTPHPSSVLFDEKRYAQPYVAFVQKSASAHGGLTFVSENTLVSTYAVLLCSRSLEVRHDRHEILVDQWLRIRASPKVATLVRAFREQLNRLLSRMYAQPGSSVAQSRTMAMMVKLLSAEV